MLDEKYFSAPDVAADPVHREVWRLEPVPFIVSGLKTLLETGKPLPSPR